MPRIAYQVHGHVQGVGFRMTTRDIARQISLTGFVRNTDSGTVEGEAQHPQQASLDVFVQKLQASPAGHVIKVDVQRITESTDQETFSMYVKSRD